MKRTSKKRNRRIELTIIILTVLFSFFFWNTIIIYPIKVFVILCHEISHGLAAILTGGKLLGIMITPDLGGETAASGGNSLIVAAAGYPGSLIFGSLLFYSAYKNKLSIWFNTILSAILFLFTVNFLSGSFSVLFAILFSVLLFVSPRYFNAFVHAYLMKILGLISSLYVLIDIKEDLITLRLLPSDAQVLATITGVPAILWGIIWFIITSVVIYNMFRFGYLKGYSKKIK